MKLILAQVGTGLGLPDNVPTLIFAVVGVLAPVVALIVWVVRTVLALQREIDSKQSKTDSSVSVKELEKEMSELRDKLDTKANRGEVKALETQFVSQAKDLAVIQAEMKSMNGKVDDVRELLTQVLTRLGKQPIP